MHNGSPSDTRERITINNPNKPLTAYLGDYIKFSHQVHSLRVDFRFMRNTAIANVNTCQEQTLTALRKASLLWMGYCQPDDYQETRARILSIYSILGRLHHSSPTRLCLILS